VENKCILLIMFRLRNQIIAYHLTNVRRGTHLIPFCLAQSVKDAARLSREEVDVPLPSIEDAVCVAISGVSGGGA
jgi:hypothetical protein